MLTAILFTIISTVNSLTYQPLNNFPSINLILNNILLVVFSLFYFKHLIDLNPFEDLKKNSTFLFNTAVLVYFTIQIFIWGIMNYLMQTHQNNESLIIFGVIVSILYYATIAIVTLIDLQNTQSKYKQ